MTDFPVETYLDALVYGDYLEEYHSKFESDAWRDKLKPSSARIVKRYIFVSRCRSRSHTLNHSLYTSARNSLYSCFSISESRSIDNLNYSGSATSFLSFRSVSTHYDIKFRSRSK